MTEKWAVLTDEYEERVADRQAIIEIIREYSQTPAVSDVDIRVDGRVIALPITAENAKRLINEIGEDNALYEAITEAFVGEPLSAYPISQWSQHWPVIDPVNMCLTGEVVTSDIDGWHNYADEAAVWDDDAKSAGWEIGEGYANPPA